MNSDLITNAFLKKSYKHCSNNHNDNKNRTKYVLRHYLPGYHTEYLSYRKLCIFLIISVRGMEK